MQSDLYFVNKNRKALKMGKKQIQKLVELQYEVLKTNNSKERLKYVVAGIRDGRLYNMIGTNFGRFSEDEDIPDTEFITDDDLALSRISSAKIDDITSKMLNFFKKYGEVSNGTDNDNTSFCNDTCNNTCNATGDKEDKENGEDGEDVVQEELNLNVDEVVKECKKAIKKGKFDKATELISLLGDDKNAKKLSKKLRKAMK